jgi:hypothetical protein
MNVLATQKMDATLSSPATMRQPWREGPALSDASIF